MIRLRPFKKSPTKDRKNQAFDDHLTLSICIALPSLNHLLAELQTIKYSLRMLVNLRKNREHHQQNSQHPTINPINHLRANTPTNLKTYRASKQQQDQCSICPSIDKVKLTQEQQRQDVHEQGSQNMYEIPVQELIAQSKLKNKALEKASYMIKLLEEENEELLSQVGYLETLLKDRERQIQALQQQIKQMKPSQSRALIKQLMNERQHVNSKHQSQNIINITNQFYTFAQHRDRSFSRKSQSKIVNIDHPSFKDMNADINISKKLTPYASKNQIEDNNTSLSNLLANLAVLIVQEGIGNSRVVMEEMNELIVAEEQEQEQIMLDLQVLEQEIDQEGELPHSPQTSKVSRRLFTLQKSTSIDSSSSITDLLQKYQRCIQGYKEYAAYLRAHLCQSINFLSQQTLPARPSESSWLSNFLKMAARDIGKSLKKRNRQLQQQNWQLKRIMEQLIHNIQMTQHGSSILHKKAH